MLSPVVTRYAPHAMVASIDHLATEAGLLMMRAGGSAVDAAIATNAVLSVTAPHACGIGGDLWALVYDGSPVPRSLDATGCSGSGADADAARASDEAGLALKNNRRTVTVPGCVDGWLALHERFGRLSLADLLAPAIRLAADGFPLTPDLQRSLLVVANAAHNELPGAGTVGDLVTRPGVARTLAAIAEEGRAGFYGGEFADGFLAEMGEEFTAGDLDEVNSCWVRPLSVEAFGHRLWTVPPTSQGYLTLLAAAIADGFVIGDDVSGIHLLIEAAVQAAHDRPDALYDGADPAVLLAPERVASRRSAIDPDRAGTTEVPAVGGGTTYLCAVDDSGMGVSLINSNASGFGSHFVAGSSGVFLQNRGLGFNLIPGHPAEYGPRRRPPHTLAPAVVTRLDGSLRSVLGTMGGDAQPQIVLQLLAATLLHGKDPGRAIGQARWRIAAALSNGFNTWAANAGRRVELEEHMAEAVRVGLAERGHEVGAAAHLEFGAAHIIERSKTGVLAGAADPRAPGSAAIGY